MNRNSNGGFRRSDDWREWLLPFSATGSIGHNPEIESFKFTAAKQPLKFRGGQEPAGATECTGLFAGSPDCWHGHLLNSGRRLHLVPAERYEGWVQAIRPDPFEDQGMGFAFEPHIKKILVLGVCGIVVRGRRGG